MVDPGPVSMRCCAACAAELPSRSRNPPRIAAPTATPVATAPPTPTPLLAATPDQEKNRIIAGRASAASTITMTPVSRVAKSWPAPIRVNPIV